MAFLNSLQNRWARPVPAASLRVIQAVFGIIMVAEVMRYLLFGWVHRYYVAPSFHFTTAGFRWIQPLGEVGMVGLFVLVGLCGAALAWGFASRFAAGLFTVAFGAIFLMDQAYYQNHLYLVLLIGLFFTIADVRTGHRARQWMLDLARFQVAVVYIFGGIAKLNTDWLNGEPMTTWMAIRGDWPIIGPLLEMPFTGLTMSWAGAAFDLLIVPLLLWRRTRKIAFAMVFLFHLSNAVLFKIGIFPSMMLALTTVFFEPDWCRRSVQHEQPVVSMGRWVLPVVLIWMVLQAAIPTRSWFYPGVTSWTEEGHRFSWRMKLRSKVGRVIFHGLNKRDGTHRIIDPETEIGRYHSRKMATRPQLIVQYAHHLRERLNAATGDDWAIHVDARAALNGRDVQTLIDPSVDLASQQLTGPAPWIVPLQD